MQVTLIVGLPCPLSTLQLILKIIDGISWPLALLAFMPRLRIHELVLEGIPIRVRRRILDNDFFVVIGKLVDDVLD